MAVFVNSAAFKSTATRRARPTYESVGPGPLCVRSIFHCVCAGSVLGGPAAQQRADSVNFSSFRHADGGRMEVASRAASRPAWS